MSAVRDCVFDDLIMDTWEPITQNSSPRINEDEHAIPHVIRLPLYKFQSESKVLMSDKPVEITITTEENNYFAENESLSIYASGDSIEFVIKEFSHHIIHFFEYYKTKNAKEFICKAVRLK